MTIRGVHWIFIFLVIFKRYAVEKEQAKVLGMADNIFCEVAMKSS